MNKQPEIISKAEYDALTIAPIGPVRTHMLHDPNGIFPEFHLADRVLKATFCLDARGEVEYSEYLPEGDGIHWRQSGKCRSLKRWEANE